MPDAKVADTKVAEAMGTFSLGFASEGLWEEPWAVWPPPVRWNPRRLLPRQCVIVRCPAIGRRGGIRIPVITNGCGFLRTLNVIPADRVHSRAGGRRHAPACNFPPGKSPLEIALSQAPNEDLGLNVVFLGKILKTRGRTHRLRMEFRPFPQIYFFHLLMWNMNAHKVLFISI